MPIVRLSEMTWEEVRAAERARSVPILPVGAVEAHGPHLPLAADVIIAESMARAGAERLEARGYLGLLLPPLAYTAAGFAANFPGTLSLAPRAVTSLVVEIARSLARHDFRVLALANAHLDPAHLASLDAAAAAIRTEGRLAVVFPDLTKKPWALRLTEEFRSGACHAGRYESSIVMAVRPDLVRESVRPSLPPNPVSLSEAIQAGKESFEEAGGPGAYFGFPADATAEEGRRSIDVLGEILAEAVLAELEPAHVA